MSKVGRNDPCPCGSGKKYKKCCAEKELPSPSTPSEALREAKVNAHLVAQKWLGTWAGEGVSAPSKAGTLTLYLDRFKVKDRKAVAVIKSWGKVEGEAVLFYDKTRWVAEILTDSDQSLTLTTTDLKTADRLSARLLALPGLEFVSRSQESFEPLDQEAKARVNSGMLEFKKKFYQTWLNEPNERLGGLSPRQARQDGNGKSKLLALLRELEQKEAELPKKDRYDFASLRQSLEL